MRLLLRFILHYSYCALCLLLTRLPGFAVLLVVPSSRRQILWSHHCCGESKSHGYIHSTAQFALLLRCPRHLLTLPHLVATQPHCSHEGCLKQRHLLSLRCSLSPVQLLIRNGHKHPPNHRCYNFANFNLTLSPFPYC